MNSKIIKNIYIKYYIILSLMNINQIRRNNFINIKYLINKNLKKQVKCVNIC